MKRFLCLATVILLFGLLNLTAQPAPVNHTVFDKLLKQHVSKTGNVNYKGFIRDSTELNKYLKTLSSNPPQNAWSKNEQLAYWINAYNAYTIQLIIRNYPLKSIKDIGSKIKIPFVNTPWDIKFIRIGKNTYDLNNIEHDILRKNFNEPRIHFAIVCASVSCPKLRNEAFVGARINEQLTAQARDFINDPRHNKITPAKAELSSIFSWFKEDFTKNGSLTDFINQFAQTKIRPNTKISYLDYNWNLN